MSGQPRVRDEFEVLAELGSGAQGKVFAARHRATGRQVAIKTLLEKVEPDSQSHERFLREARVRIDSPYVVQVYDLRIEQGQVYIIMELVQGQTLEHLLAQRPPDAPPIPLVQILILGEQIALALDAAHRQGIVHRDVKPANVFVAPDGRAKLGDFGIAKDLNSLEALTASGLGMGTLAYVAPEQASDAKRVEDLADLYSLGATLYHLLAGRPPFQPNNAIEFVTTVLNTQPPPLTELRPDCPPDVVALVERTLEKDPQDRPASAGAIARRLKKLREKYATAGPR